MKNGYYWARFYHDVDDWRLVEVVGNAVYSFKPASDHGVDFDFPVRVGSVDKLVRCNPYAEFVEIEKPKSEELTLIVDVLVGDFKTTVGKVVKKGSVTYAVVNECDKEAFLDDVAQYYRNRAEELLYARPEV